MVIYLRGKVPAKFGLQVLMSDMFGVRDRKSVVVPLADIKEIGQVIACILGVHYIMDLNYHAASLWSDAWLFARGDTECATLIISVCNICT